MRSSNLPALLVLVIGAVFLPVPALFSQFTTLWTIGVENDDPQELGGETWPQNNAPGSATALDNDYYLAGTYSIGTVPVAEPASQFERVLSGTNHTQRTHFNLSAAQATATARIRFYFKQVWGGWWNDANNTSGTTYGTHAIEVRLNGSVIGTKTFTARGAMLVEANAGTFTPVAGENVLQITRLASPASTYNGWLQFDYLQMEINPVATQDADGDGIPRWWEEDHGFSDQNAADAALDPDNDGLTNAQEYARGTLPRDPDTDKDGLKDGYETNTGVFVSATNTGTDPNNPDTDGDTLLDGEEVALSPRPNPLLVDTDGDGAPDAWEVRTKFDPTLASSKPPAFPSAIGVKFVSEQTPESVLVPRDVTGVVPQMNWNVTRPLSTWTLPNGTLADITTPLAGKLVNATGADSGASLSWASPTHSWGTGNFGGATQRLFDGMLGVSSDNPATVTVTQIPYATYDVIAYVGSTSETSLGYIRLNDQTSSDRHFSTASSNPVKTFIEQTVYNATVARRGNTIRYKNVTGSSFNLKVFRIGYHNVGLHGLQIVSSTADSDGDGMPDGWEYNYGFNPGSNTDATQDADGDGLNNLGEKNRGTDPRNPDTDGDGLTDLVETGTGVWVSATNTGTSPLLQDTDGDGLTDKAEVDLLPYPTNPNLADTDGDGRSDYEEVTQRTDPLSTTFTAANMPVITTSPRTFTWSVDNIQLVWDHSKSKVDWNENLLMLSVSNTLLPGEDAMSFSIPVRNGRVSYYFFTDYRGAFSHPDNDAWSIWESDWTSTPPNLAAGYGFSGKGKQDISDRLRFRVSGTSTGSQTNWSVTFAIINLDTNQTIISRTWNNCALALPVHNNTVSWQSRDPILLNRLRMEVPDGVQVYQLNTRLEDAPAFAAVKDSDNDGMPDVWEDQYTLNKNSAADALVDSDNDGLLNIDEYLNGTHPRQRDTDGDGAPDGLEVSSRSNPLLATSLPPLFRGTPALGTGEDLNGNGLSDAWEAWAGSFGLVPGVDSDGDGMTNEQEAAAGTDPFDPNSRLWSSITVQGNDIVVRWPVLLYKDQKAWRSSDLANWALAPGTASVVGDEFRQIFVNALNTTPTYFYKVRLLDMDSDGDGVTDWTERNVLGSDPYNANSTRSASSVDLSGDGVVDSTLSGDYANMVEQFQGGRANGGFPGTSGTPGGGSGGTGGSQPISRAQASRFLSQATFGPTVEDIQSLQNKGFETWIQEQAAQPPTLNSTYIRSIYNDLRSQHTGTGYNYGGEGSDKFLFGNNLMSAFARGAVQGEDQLRQRMAFALSQILVASRRDSALENKVLGMADFYDIFIRNGLGNYYNVLREVTFHPIMGRYLSHVGNQKARPEINQYPDENYAREVMQLFSIGLWELNPDGSRKLDSEGHPIPTYSNTEITQVARVLTGLWYSGQSWGYGGWDENSFATPMTMNPERHDFGMKTLLHGFVIPARAPSKENALRDIEDLVRMLFEHPNTAVYIGRQLIQFFVTDNPSPAYIQRVSSVFANNGQGVRGDLLAVIKAVLMDEEARDPRFTSYGNANGRLKEPVIRAMAMARAFGMKQEPNLLWWDWGNFYGASRQEPTFSPSVFNFYRPDYQAPGTLTQNGMTNPVFQITDSFSSISLPNQLWTIIQDGMSFYNAYRAPFRLDREIGLAGSPELLADHMNVIFCAGGMKPETRTKLINAVSQISPYEPIVRAQVAAYLAIVCPEGAVLR